MKGLKGIWTIAGLLVLLSVAIIGWLDVIELRAEEPRRAVVAMEMYLSGDYIRPTLLGESYYNKPPLYSWVLGASYFVTGTFNEFAVRLPGVLSFLLTGLCIFLFAKRYLNREVALWAAFGYLSCFALLFYATVNAGEIDLFYSWVTMLQVFAIFHFSEKEKWWQLFLFSYALAAVGLLTKGLPSLLFQGITLLVWFIVQKRFWKLFSLQHIAGLVVFLVLVGGYFYLYDQRDDLAGYLTKLVDESSEHSFVEATGGQAIVSLVRFPLLVLLHVFPLGIGLLLLIKKNYRQKLKENPLLRFSWMFIAANIILYWIMPKFIGRYLYMFIPFFMFISAFLLTDFLKSEKNRKMLLGFFAGCIGLVGITHVIVLFVEQQFITIEAAIAIPLGIVFLIMAYLTWRNRSHSNAAIFIAGAIFLLRISYNIGVMPGTQENINKSNNYRDLTAKLIDKAKGEPIRLLGRPQTKYPKIGLFGYTFYQDTVQMTVHVPFQFAYYYKLQSGELMQFKSQPEQGVHHLGYRVHVEKFPELQLVDSFKVSIRDHTMVLAR